jgi:UDP-N-acetylglucosamine--N-acetylmuramyl-(pentapeptide) pyrophosphoryl-undecaprenol N-acetylglucosamine transferase
MASFRVLLAGGGTGGHIYPLVAVAEEIKNISVASGAQVEMRFIGDGELLRQCAAEIGFKSTLILSPKWRRYFSVQNFIDILKFPIGFIQALFNVWAFMPDVIFAKGGYASFLPALAGRIFMIPVFVHESDTIPGQANMILGKMAKRVFLSFDSSKKYFNENKCVITGNPIRAGVMALTDRAAALQAFSLDPNKPTVLITGASQGAQKINEILLLSLVELTKKFQIIHQCGAKNFEDTSKRMAGIVEESGAVFGPQIQNNYRLYPALDMGQMALAYSASDIVVSRAGSQIFEIASWGKPLIAVPLKNSASNHQLMNAREITKFGAILVEEDNLTPRILITEIEGAYQNKNDLSQRIKQFARPDAAATIAKELLGLA